MTQNISCAVITFNTAGKPPPDDRQPDVFDLKPFTDADVLVIGLQECARGYAYLTGYDIDHAWSAYFRQRLSLPHNYIQLAPNAFSAYSVSLLIFVRPLILHSLRGIQSRSVTHEVTPYITTSKATIIISLLLSNETRLTFACSHLTPHPRGLYLAKRVQQMQTVLAQEHALMKQDLTIWCGDFNYRAISAVERPLLIRRLKDNTEDTIDMLKNFDELRCCMNAGEILDGFTEPPLNFAPTYKLNFLDGTFNETRDPSWTDRIVYSLSQGKIQSGRSTSQPIRELDCVKYDSLPKCTWSDHCPVYAIFSLTVDKQCLCPSWAVEFVDLPKSHFRQLKLELHFTMTNEYRLKDMSSLWDYITFYEIPWRKEFPAADTIQIAHWQYTVTSWQMDNEPAGHYHLTVDSLPPAGAYKIGYYSKSRSCLVGLSDTIQLT